MIPIRWLRRFSGKVAFCTVATPDYLPMAAVLIDSIRAAYGSRCDIHVLIVANTRVPFEYGNANLYYAPDLPDTFYWDMVLRYDLACRACALKPMFARHINSLRRYDALFYLDADAELFGRLVEAEKLMCDPGTAILLLPHSSEPRFLGRRPIDDRSFLSVGTFNAGLFGVNASKEAFAFLSWWWRLNQTECSYDTVHLSRDQKWLNLAPAYFDGTRILRHAGYNVAHFNYDERRAVLTNGDLRLFHYTMLHQYQWDVKTYVERHQLKNDPNLVLLLNRYVRLVREKEQELKARFTTTATLLATAPANAITLSMREVYRRMCPEPKSIASREECDEIRKHLVATVDALPTLPDSVMDHAP